LGAALIITSFHAVPRDFILLLQCRRLGGVGTSRGHTRIFDGQISLMTCGCAALSQRCPVQPGGWACETLASVVHDGMVLMLAWGLAMRGGVRAASACAAALQCAATANCAVTLDNTQ